MPNITVYRGDNWPLLITVKNAATGAVINITGYQFVLTVDRKENPPTPSTTMVFDIDGVLTDAANGQVTFTPSSVNHSTVGNFYYDIQMTNTQNNKKTIAKGQYIISQDISK